MNETDSGASDNDVNELANQNRMRHCINCDTAIEKPVPSKDADFCSDQCRESFKLKTRRPSINRIRADPIL